MDLDMWNNDFEKILFVGPRCDKPKGGVAAVLHVYSKMFSPFLYVESTRGGGLLKLFFTFIKAFFIYLRYMCNSNIQIVHLHSASNGSFYRKGLLAIIAWLFRKKIVFHIHGGGFKAFTSKHGRLVRFVLLKCDIIVCLSEYWKNFFQYELGLSRVFIINNVIERPREDHSLRQDEVCRFLFLGKICDEKGLFDLIDVVSAHQEQLRGHFMLTIGGNGDVMRLISEINCAGIQDMVEYAGFVDGDNKIWLFNESHALILPSYIEGVPVTILEAYSYHLPVISTNVGGIPQILTDGKQGIVINPGDKMKMFSAIQEFIASPQKRISYGNAGYDTCTQHLPMYVKEELGKLYKILIA